MKRASTFCASPARHECAFPRPGASAVPEAVILNTAGGLTGGDRMSVEVALADDCAATITSAAAEKVYRSLGDATDIAVELRLGARAACCWLPQPTILFGGSNLQRSTTVHMAGSARLLAVEMLLFGRTAMGEDVQRGSIRDAWRVRRDGRLVFADTTRAMGAVAHALDRGAVLDGARATAMLLYVAPDAEARLDEVRALLERASERGWRQQPGTGCCWSEPRRAMAAACCATCSPS